MSEQEIITILTDWNFWGNFKEDLRERSLYLSTMNNLLSPRTALFLKGIRRCGKSSLAYLFCRQILDSKKASLKESLIVNFEDPRLPNKPTTIDLMKIYETYLRIINPSDPVIILDEIQQTEGWEKFVRFLIESKRHNVIITGSPSKLSPKEVSQTLAGRHVDLDVFPLGFFEFLSFQGISITSEAQMFSARIKIIGLLDQYIDWGGFPEVTLTESLIRKKELLQRYFEDILIKDVIKQNGIKEIDKAENLAHLLVSNISTLQSFNKLKNKINASLDTVERFTKYFEQSGLFLFVKKFDFSLTAQILSIRKCYVADTGLYTLKSFRLSENKGRVLENIVAIELVRRKARNDSSEIFYWKDYQQREVDFVVKQEKHVVELIQVTGISGLEELDKREVSALLIASEELKCNHLKIITTDVDKEIKTGGKKIILIPLWRWLTSYYLTEI